MKTSFLFLALTLAVFAMFVSTIYAAELAITTSQSPTLPGAPVKITLTATNESNTLLNNVELRINYPQNLYNMYTQYFSTGGAANSVSCEGDSSTNYCEAGETVIWSIGAIPAGEGVTVHMAPTVGTNQVDGTIIEFEAELWVDGVQQQTMSKSVSVQSQPFFELTVSDHNAPYVAISSTEFVISYSNIGSTTTTETKLTFPLPERTNFVKATDGGTFSKGDVVWNLDSLSTGQGGELKILASLNSSEGQDLFIDPVTISGTNSSLQTYSAQYSAAAFFNSAEKPSLSLNLGQNPILPNADLNLSLSVTNTASYNLNNVQLILQYPGNLYNINTSTISTGGSANTVSCYGDPSTTYCEPGEFVVWELGTLLPGTNVELSVQPTVSSSTAYGTMIPFQAEIRVDGKQVTTGSKTAFIGSNFSNAGSYSTIVCGDVNGDTSIDLADMIMVLQTMAGESTSISPLSDCDQDGRVEMSDAMRILKQLQ